MNPEKTKCPVCHSTNIDYFTVPLELDDSPNSHIKVTICMKCLNILNLTTEEDKT